MNYATIKLNDIANGTGVRVSLFVSGCTHHCKGCFNAEAWDFAYGEPFTTAVEDGILEAMAPAYVSGLSLLGGEPLEPAHQRALLPLLRRMKALYPEKTVWCYSGYLLDKDLLAPEGRARTEVTDELLSMLTVLVDGPFVEELKDISLRFRGSSNQRIIDVPATLATGEIQQKEWGDYE